MMRGKGLQTHHGAAQMMLGSVLVNQDVFLIEKAVQQGHIVVVAGFIDQVHSFHGPSVQGPRAQGPSVQGPSVQGLSVQGLVQGPSVPGPGGLDRRKEQEKEG